MWNNFHQMHWAISEGMVSLFQLQPKSAIVALLIAAKWSVGNEMWRSHSSLMNSFSLHESSN